MNKTLSARWLYRLLCLLALLPGWAQAQNFEFKTPATVEDAATPAAMRDLAERILPVYQDADIERYLATLSVLQLVAGNYPAANDARRSLRERRRHIDVARPVGRGVLLDLYAQAKAGEASGGGAFAPAFAQSYREVVPKLSDLDAYTVSSWLAAPPAWARDALQRAFDRQRSKPGLSLAEALDLMRLYLAYDSARNVGAQAEALAAEDDRQRYVVEENLPVKARGATIYVRLIRPKNLPKPVPALLEFTLYQSLGDARAAAAHGYVGVVAYTRGKTPGATAAASAKPGSKNRSGAGAVVPFQRDGEDARAVIEWIAKQPWSDGRVGMIGSGYSGFAAWSAAKRLPPALKAIATTDAMAPGISFPGEGRIVRNAALRFADTRTHAGDGPAVDEASWAALDQAWYRSGKPYRALERLAKLASPIFRTWLTHPSYDRYWQKMIPFRQQFAQIGIPVLSTTGYYADGAVGALYYYAEHMRYRADADHTLLIGPYDDATQRDRPASALRGYTVDPAALVDLRELRLQWFDHLFKGAAKPALLKDRVNYQLSGSNEWRHVPSIAAMSNSKLKLYLEGGTAGRPRLLAAATQADFIEQTVNFADRKAALALPGSELLVKSLSAQDALVFVGEPLQQATELAGLLQGQLDFTMNKMDLDLNLRLYEQLPGGDYLQLADAYEFRASYAQDRVERHLLKAGVRQQLAFSSEQLTGRRLQAGSRVVLVLGVNKRPDRQINYGSGKDVKEESIADARVPLRIRWYGGSYVELPIRR